MAQAEKEWNIRKKANIDPEPHGVHITMRREGNKEEHVKIHWDLYYHSMINIFVDEIHEQGGKDVEECLKNLKIQDEEEKVVIFRVVSPEDVAAPLTGFPSNEEESGLLTNPGSETIGKA
ncbi:hypothetical protein RHMOL_Rhmol03G0190300 [Rhododendron molle]|uniref:Uncharacterized protein n=1 Tax=Rhododendron molle TaxID=49168 RepID=A0ACC0PGH7_RHOML|nr:hypothetical protein RHMOL_Rhmol03G0190300 [Rhododendron molle]